MHVIPLCLYFNILPCPLCMYFNVLYPPSNVLHPLPLYMYFNVLYHYPYMYFNVLHNPVAALLLQEELPAPRLCERLCCCCFFHVQAELPARG